MLYEPPKTKRYILIGASAVVLAVLAIVAIPILYKNKINARQLAIETLYKTVSFVNIKEKRFCVKKNSPDATSGLFSRNIS